MNFLNKFNLFFIQQEKKKAQLKLAKDTKFYNSVYDILITIGALSNMRQSFIQSHIKDCYEWRFISVFGEGTKYLSRYNKVSTNIHSKKVNEINLKLSKIYKF